MTQWLAERIKHKKTHVAVFYRGARFTTRPQSWVRILRTKFFHCFSRRFYEELNVTYRVLSTTVVVINLYTYCQSMLVWSWRTFEDSSQLYNVLPTDVAVAYIGLVLRCAASCSADCQTTRETLIPVCLASFLADADLFKDLDFKFVIW